jgi:hypothetical protein
MSLQDLEDLALPPPSDDDEEQKRQQASYDAAMAAPDVQLPGQYVANMPLLPPSYAPNDPNNPDNHIPLDHATQLATPPSGPPVATVGMTPRPMPPQPPSLAQNVNPYQYLLNRGQNLNAQNLNPEFANRLTQAIQAAESATGSQARLNDLYRPPEVQAQYYANWTQQPVNFNGVTYVPTKQGGLAAPPGHSQHERGIAADVGSGPVLDYLHQNAGRYGLEFLRGNAGAVDPVHIELAGGRGGGPAGGIPSAGPGAAVYQKLLNGFRNSNLVGVVPPDGARFGITTGSPEEWARFGTAVANAESSFNPNEGPPNSHETSYGLFQYDHKQVPGGNAFNPDASIAQFITDAESSAHGLGSGILGQRFSTIGSHPERTISRLGKFGGGSVATGAAGDITGLGYGGVRTPGGLMMLSEPQQDEEQPPSDEQELEKLKNELASLGQTAPTGGPPPPAPQPAVADLTPGLPPVNLQPAATTPDVAAMAGMFGGGAMPSLSQTPTAFPSSTTQAQDLAIAQGYLSSLGSGPTHTVIGADGQPQTIDAGLAAIDPTIGMTKGIAQSPQVKAEELAGVVPRLDQMTHGGLPLTTPTKTETISRMIGRDIGRAINPINTLESMAQFFESQLSKAPGQVEVDPSEAGAALQTVFGMAGARFPMALRGEGELGALGGKMIQPEYTGPLRQDIHPADTGAQAAYQQGQQDARAGEPPSYSGDKKFSYAYDRGRNDGFRALREAQSPAASLRSPALQAIEEAAPPPGAVRDAATGRLRDAETGQFMKEVSVSKEQFADAMGISRAEPKLNSPEFEAALRKFNDTLTAAEHEPEPLAAAAALKPKPPDFETTLRKLHAEDDATAAAAPTLRPPGFEATLKKLAAEEEPEPLAAAAAPKTTLKSPALEAIEKPAPKLSPIGELLSLKEPSQFTAPPAAGPAIPAAAPAPMTPRQAGTNLRAARAKLAEQLPEAVRPTTKELRGMSLADVNKLVAERSKQGYVAPTLGAPPAELRVPKAQPEPSAADESRIRVRPPVPAAPAPVTPATPAAPAAGLPPLTPAQIQSAVPAELLPPAITSPLAPNMHPPLAPGPYVSNVPPVKPPTAAQTQAAAQRRAAQAAAPSLSQTPATPPGLPAGMTQAPRAATEAEFLPRMYARLGDSLTDSLISFGREAGLDAPTLRRLSELNKSTTGPQATSIAEAAVSHGRAISPGFNFNVNEPIRNVRLFAHKNPGFWDYMHLYDTLDDIQMKQNIQRGGPNQQGLPLAHPQYGPVSVRGETKISAQHKIDQFERAHPEFVTQRGHFRAHLQELWREEAEGEYGLHTKQKLADMNAHNANKVPWTSGHTREYGENGSAYDARGRLIERGDAGKAMEARTINGARKKMANVANMSYIDAVRSSPRGQTMFEFKTPEQAAALPRRLKQKLVVGKRRGVTEHWLARNKTIAQIMDHDPKAMSSSATMALANMSQRLFTASTTGLLSHFAETDAYRNYKIAQETIAGTREGRGFLNLIPPKGSLNPWAKGRIQPPGMFGIRQALMGQGKWFEGSNSRALRGVGRFLPLGPGAMQHAWFAENVPKVAEFMLHSLNHTSGGQWLKQKLGPTASQHISTLLSHAYHKAAVATTEAMGTHVSGIMSAAHVRATNDMLTRSANNVMNDPKYRHLATIINLYKNLIMSTHGMAHVAGIQRNLPRNWSKMSQADREAAVAPLFSVFNDVVGNPKTAGRYYAKSGPIHYDMEDSTSIIRKAAAMMAESWVASNQVGREISPWHNMILQGGKAQLAALRRNPTEFMIRKAIYGTGLYAANYLWNVWQGKDPDGVPYVNHQMYGRGEYPKAMSTYWGLQGRRVADGIELPVAYQEDVIHKMLVEAYMDHLFGNNAWTMPQDAQAALTNWLDIAFLPPIPPALGQAFAATGTAPPQNVGAFLPNWLVSGLGQNSPNVDIGGDVYKRKNNPFDQNRIAGQNTESYLRAVAPTIADMLIGGTAAFVHTPEGLETKLKNAIKQMGRSYVQALPFTRDYWDIHPPLSALTRYQQELYNRQQAIEQIDEFQRKFGETGVRDVVRKKPLSKGGDAGATARMGYGHLPHELPGLDQPEPTNPLYIEFAKELYNLTKHDSPRTGGFGYRSLWDRYREATEGVQSMQKIDYGNMGAWHRNLVQNKPGVVDLMTQEGIDHRDPWQVRNWWEHRRQAAAKTINQAIDEIENRFNSSPMGQDFQRVHGKRLRIDDLDPYGVPGITASGGTPETEEFVPGARRILPWAAPEQLPQYK